MDTKQLRVPSPELEPIDTPAFIRRDTTERWHRLKLFVDYAVSTHGRVCRLTASRGTKPGLLHPEPGLVLRKGKGPVWGIYFTLFVGGKRYKRNIGWLLGNVKAVQKKHKKAAETDPWPARTEDLPRKQRGYLFNMQANLAELPREEAEAKALKSCGILGIPEARMLKEVAVWFDGEPVQTFTPEELAAIDGVDDAESEVYEESPPYTPIGSVES